MKNCHPSEPWLTGLKKKTQKALGRSIRINRRWQERTLLQRV